jgi:hypothetical protein
MEPKKPIAEVIMASMGKKPEMMEAPEHVEGVDKEIDSSHEIAKDAMAAMKSGDAQGFIESMKALFQSFESQPHMENEEE